MIHWLLFVCIYCICGRLLFKPFASSWNRRKKEEANKAILPFLHRHSKIVAWPDIMELKTPSLSKKGRSGHTDGTERGSVTRYYGASWPHHQVKVVIWSHWWQLARQQFPRLFFPVWKKDVRCCLFFLVRVEKWRRWSLDQAQRICYVWALSLLSHKIKLSGCCTNCTALTSMT